jgi:simple sugar transport system ATP-binding protein
MAGGQELAELSHELRGIDPGKVVAPHEVQHGALDPGLTEDEVAKIQSEFSDTPQGTPGNPSEEK